MFQNKIDFKKMNLIEPNFKEDQPLFFNSLILEMIQSKKIGTPFQTLNDEFVKYLTSYCNQLLLLIDKSDISDNKIVKELLDEMFLNTIDSNHGCSELRFGFRNGVKSVSSREKGIGGTCAKSIVLTLKELTNNSNYSKKNALSILSQVFYGVDSTSVDKVSDLMGRIVRKPLTEYTKELLKEVNYTHKNKGGYYWDLEEEAWKYDADLIPCIEINGILEEFVFMPKLFVFTEKELEKYGQLLSLDLRGKQINIKKSWSSALPGSTTHVLLNYVYPRVQKTLGLYFSELINSDKTSLNFEEYERIETKVIKRKNKDIHHPGITFSSDASVRYLSKRWNLKKSTSKKSICRKIIVNPKRLNFLDSYGMMSSNILKELDMILDLQEASLEKIIMNKFKEVGVVV